MALINIGVLIGLLAYASLYLGKGIQKYAIEGFKDKEGGKSKHSGIWIVGTILTAVYMFIQWGALLFAPINLIAPLEGMGLIVLLIFSYFVLKEAITKIELGGVGFIIAGIVFITAFNQNTSDVVASMLNTASFYTILIVLIIVEGALALVLFKLKHKFLGIVLATTAGTMMAFQTVSKRITAIPNSAITFPFTIMVLVFATMTLVFTQLSFAKGKANRVLPIFTSASIVLAMIIGIFTISEIINMFQVIGISCVVLGVICITAFGKEDQLTISKVENQGGN